MQIGLIIPVLRQILQVAGGALIAKGVLDSGSADAATGIILNAVTLGWWLYDRIRINASRR